MNMPTQLELTDIVVYFAIGVLYMLLGQGVYYNVTGELLFKLTELRGVEIVAVFPVAYVSGFMAPNLVFFYLSKNRLEPSLLNTMLCIKSNYDSRVLDEESLHWRLVKGIIKDKFGENAESIFADKESKREFFYIVARHEYNICSGFLVSLLKRNLLIVNLYAKLLFFFVMFLIVIISGIVAKVFFHVGNLSCGILFLIFAFGYVVVLYLSKRVQRAIRVWTKNVWRALIAVQMN